MPKKIGITLDPERRQYEHRVDHPSLKDWRVLFKSLTKEEAVKKQRDLIDQEKYEYCSGGDYPDNGQLKYSVYIFTY